MEERTKYPESVENSHSMSEMEYVAAEKNAQKKNGRMNGNLSSRSLHYLYQ